MTDPTLGTPPDDNDGDFDASKYDRGDKFEIDADLTAKKAEEEAAEAAKKAEEEAAEAAKKAEEEAAEAGEKTEKPTKSKKAPSPVPYERFKEVNDAKRAAEARLAAIDAEKAAEKQGEESKYDFDAAEAKYAEFLLDGKTAEAAQLRKEIRGAERAEFEATARKAAEASATAAQQRRSVEEVIAEATEKYGAFDPDHEEYNEEAVQDVESLFRGYVSAGMSHAQAMSKAISKGVKMYGLDASEGEPEKKPKPEEKVEPIKHTKEKLELAGKQPAGAALAGAGGSSEGASKINPAELTEEEFNALPPATLARLRGDMVA